MILESVEVAKRNPEMVVQSARADALFSKQPKVLAVHITRYEASETKLYN